MSIHVLWQVRGSMPPKVELKKYSATELRFVIHDEDKHSLPNLIAKLAIREPGVKYAAYIIDHPLVSPPEVVILTEKGVDPLDVLIRVLEKAKRISEELRDRLVSYIEAKG